MLNILIELKYFNARTILYTKLEDTEMPVYENYSDSKKTSVTFYMKRSNDTSE